MKCRNVLYRKRLPHLVPRYGTFFVTFRLYNSIPKAIAEKINEKFEILTLELKSRYSGSELTEKLDQLNWYPKLESRLSTQYMIVILKRFG